MTSRPRTAIWASALGVAVFHWVGSFGAADNQLDRRAIDAVAIVLLLLGPAALAVRDRWPLLAVGVTIAAADVYIGLGYPYGPIFLSVVVALVTAVLAGRRRETWALAAVGAVGFGVAHFLDSRTEDPSLLHLALVVGWLAVVLAVAEVVRVRRDQAAERKRAEAEQRQLRLAQELHDVLAHNISLINVQASVALHLLDEHPDQARPALANIKTASRDALHELRTAIDVLRRGDEAPRDPAPRLADLDTLLDGVRAGGLDVRFTCEGLDDGTLPAAVELAAYRIVQEALTNVTRHAHARSVEVRVARSNDDVTIEVVDDGRGAVTTAAGNGIVGMRERAAALGGTLDAGPSPGGGFRVVATLPARAQ